MLARDNWVKLVQAKGFGVSEVLTSFAEAYL